MGGWQGVPLPFLLFQTALVESDGKGVRHGERSLALSTVPVDGERRAAGHVAFDPQAVLLRFGTRVGRGTSSRDQASFSRPVDLYSHRFTYTFTLSRA